LAFALTRSTVAQGPAGDPEQERKLVVDPATGRPTLRGGARRSVLGFQLFGADQACFWAERKIARTLLV